MILGNRSLLIVGGSTNKSSTKYIGRNALPHCRSEGAINKIATTGLHSDIPCRSGLHMSNLATSGHRNGLIASIAINIMIALTIPDPEEFKDSHHAIRAET